MAETKSLNEKLISLFETELITILEPTYYINIDTFYKYIPVFDDGKTFEDTVCYAVINDENPDNTFADKGQLFNFVDVEIGVIIKTNSTNIETHKENIKKSIKKYLTANKTIRKLSGYDARVLSFSPPVIKWYENVFDKNRILVTFNLKIKSILI